MRDMQGETTFTCIMHHTARAVKHFFKKIFHTSEIQPQIPISAFAAEAIRRKAAASLRH
jgi:hypothetical protein